MLKPAEIYTHTHTHTIKTLPRFLCKLCLGAVLIFAPIFSFSATLPSGYTELEYIESNGTQYIDTGINADSDLGVDFKYQFTSTSPRQRIGAIYDNGAPVTTNASNYIRHHLNVDSRSHSDVAIGYYIGLFDDNFDLSNPIDTNIHTFVLDTVNNRYIVDGNTNTYNADNFDTHLNYWLFIRNSNNSDLYSPSSMRIYYFKMKRNGALVRDFMPAKRNSDGVVGMYDLVHGVFYTNTKTTTYTQLESLSNSNISQYIQDDTLTSLDSGTIEIKVGNVVANNTRFVGWGSSNDGTTLDAAIAIADSGGRYTCNYGGDYHWFIIPDNNYNINDVNVIKYKFEPDLQEVRVNDVLRATSNQPARTNHNYPFRMFGASTNYPSNGTSTIYYCKVYDGDGDLLREYIPVKDSNNVLGMYETQTGRFLTNAGSGTFIAGANVGTYTPNFIAGPAVAQPATVEIIWGGLAEPDASGMCTYGGTFTAPSTAPTAPSGLKFLGWRPIGQ